MHALRVEPLNQVTVPRTGAAHSALQRFEEAFAQTVGARYAVALDSPSSALRLALEALGVKPGDEIVTSPYNSRVAAEVITRLGARPVFVDVEEYSLNINARLIDGAVTGKTKAILAVHTAGLPSDIPTIHQIAGRHGLPVVEDGTYAFPAEYRGTMVGGASSFACLGLHGSSKNAGEQGGMLCTSNPLWAERCRVTAHRMDENLAAASLANLANVEVAWIRRTEIAREYNHALVEMPELQIPADRFDCEHAWNLYMLRLNLELLTIDRAAFLDELIQRGVDARVHYIPLHVHPFCRERYGHEPEDFPVSYREHLREVSLPISAEMSKEEVQHVIDAVGEIVKERRA